MNNDSPPELTILEGLRSAIGSECPECGEINSSGAEFCEFCNAELEVTNEEDPQFSYVHSEGIGQEVYGASMLEDFKKIPLEQSSNLKLLVSTIERTSNGEITLEEYRANVMTVYNAAKAGVDLFDNQLFQKQLKANMPEDIIDMAAKAEALYRKFLAGCQQMLDYDGGTDGTNAVMGFAEIERALTEMDKLQDDIIESK